MNIKDILPVPQMREAKRILCVQPHPDDMDISAGATLSLLADLGIEINYLTVTDDSAGFHDAGADNLVRRQDQRKEEQMAAGNVIGVKGYYWLNYPDAGNWSQYDARNLIIKHIRMLRPDFIFTVDPWLIYEAHMDHIKTGRAASEALLLYNFPFIITEPEIDKNFDPYDINGIVFTFTAKPNTVMDVTGYRERKFNAIAEHKSQFTEESFGMLKMYDEMKCRMMAEGKGFEFGEGFKVLNPQFMLHCFPEAIEY